MALNDIKGSEVREGVTSSGGGGFTLTGAGIDFYQILIIKQQVEDLIARIQRERGDIA